MRKEKQLLLDEIKEKIKSNGSFILTRYQGLQANSSNDLRGEVAKIGGELEVVRKRILVKAALEQGIELDLQMLEGHIGVVFPGEDSVETAKTLFEFGKSSNGQVEVIGGHVDGKLVDAAQMELLSKLPGKDEMRAQLLGLFEAPMSQTLATMEALVCSVVYCLDNKVKEESGS